MSTAAVPRILVTGERDAGKTVFCRAVVEAVRALPGPPVVAGGGCPRGCAGRGGGELGRLECEEGGGWSAGLAAVDSGAFTAAVVVVRPRLLSEAHRRWP